LGQWWICWGFAKMFWSVNNSKRGAKQFLVVFTKITDCIEIKLNCIEIKFPTFFNIKVLSTRHDIIIAFRCVFYKINKYMGYHTLPSRHFPFVGQSLPNGQRVRLGTQILWVWFLISYWPETSEVSLSKTSNPQSLTRRHRKKAAHCSEHVCPQFAVCVFNNVCALNWRGKFQSMGNNTWPSHFIHLQPENGFESKMASTSNMDIYLLVKTCLSGHIK